MFLSVCMDSCVCACVFFGVCVDSCVCVCVSQCLYRLLCLRLCSSVFVLILVFALVFLSVCMDSCACACVSSVCMCLRLRVREKSIDHTMKKCLLTELGWAERENI